ncbi:MAG: MarR family transcriptional regulator [Aerococcaceae bacterium]|nr:MarR family transcriptional regulator [Aerococcaceae bacterium]
MNKQLEQSKLFARVRDENFSLYEYYARAHGMHSKSLLILMWIYYTPAGISQHTICKKTYSTKQVVSATIKAFLQKGHVYFEADSLDKRAKKIKLTPEGHQFASGVLDELEAAEVAAMKKLSDDQRSYLIESLSLFNQHFKEALAHTLAPKKEADQ